jgi:hypothetical protein
MVIRNEFSFFVRLHLIWIMQFQIQNSQVFLIHFVFSFICGFKDSPHKILTADVTCQETLSIDGTGFLFEIYVFFI